MDVLVLNGSPRKGGNTELLVKSVISGIDGAGGRATDIRLCDLEIKSCIGCGTCEKKGECILKDDMIDLYDKIIVADRIVLASPIYFYGITSQAKAFVDRTQTLWSRKYILKKGEKWYNDPSRKGYLVSVAATKGEKVFEGAILTAKYGFDAMGVSYGGEFLVRGAEKRGAVADMQDILQKAELFGRKIVCD